MLPFPFPRVGETAPSTRGMGKFSGTVSFLHIRSGEVPSDSEGAGTQGKEIARLTPINTGC
jgi:hypothetical protein